MGPRSTGSFMRVAPRLASALGSEFGRVIENLMDVPGAMGAVLVDEDGFAIDYVRDPAALDDLDVQLLGAQINQVVASTQRSAAKHDMGTPVVLLEGDRANLIAGPVGEIYVLAFMLHREANMAQGLDHFEAVRSTVEHLLT